jgi:hypothetical protein
MPGKDGTGPLGMGPCGRDGCECRKRQENAGSLKDKKSRHDAGVRQPDRESG